MYRYFYSYMFKDFSGWGYGNGELETTHKIDDLEDIREIEKVVADKNKKQKITIINIQVLQEI